MTLKVIFIDIEVATVACVESIVIVDLIFKAFNPWNIDYTINIGVDLMLLVQVLRSALDERIKSLDACRIWLQAPVFVFWTDERTDYRVHQEDITNVW